MFREHVSKYKRQCFPHPVTQIYPCPPWPAAKKPALALALLVLGSASKRIERLIYLAHAHVDRAALIVLALVGRAAPATAECASVCRPAPAGPPEAPLCPCPPCPPP